MTQPITPAQVEEAKRLEAAATKGPWERSYIHVVRFGRDGANVCSCGEPRASTEVGYTPLDIGSADGDEAYANAAFIARSRELLTAALARIEADAERWAKAVPLLEQFRSRIETSRMQGSMGTALFERQCAEIDALLLPEAP